ncbi:MAG: arylesterase [Candidatus Eremiobacterota bacterium]
MRTRWLVGATIGLLVVGVWLLFGRSPRIAHLGPREGPIVVLGDSLAAGVGAKSGRGYVKILEERLKVPMVNRGIPGNTTRQGLERLERDVLTQKPALVILELGGNDFLQRVPTDETFANLEEMVRRIHAQGAPVLLIGVQSGVFMDKQEKRYRELASRHQTAYVPNILKGILTNPGLKDDAIHPNDAGYEVVADRIEPTLRQMLKKMHRI